MTRSVVVAIRSGRGPHGLRFGGSMRRMKTVVRSVLVASTLAATALLGGVPAVAGMNDDAPKDVLYDGQRVTGQQLTAARSASSTLTVIHVAGAPDGFEVPPDVVAVAFEDRQDADAWLHERGVTSVSDAEWAAIERQNASRRVGHDFSDQADASGGDGGQHLAVGGPLVASATSVSSWVLGQRQLQALHLCPSLTYGARIYEHSDCGGSYLGIFETDSISRLSDYGWNDRASSIVERLGDSPCIQWVRLYQHADFGGVTDFYWSFETPSNLGGFNDEASSLKAGCS